MLLAAPIQGYTDDCWRIAHAKCIGGVDEYYTPFVRLEKGCPREKDVRALRNPRVERRHTVVQILACSRAEARTLVSLVASLGYSRVDMNFGCPFAPIVQAGYGAGMLGKVEAMKDVLSVTEDFPEVRFSAKLRLGGGSEVVQVLNGARLVHVVLHPRTVAQQYRGVPDASAFQEFAAACVHPLVWNGDITAPRQVREHNHVMIGRGLLVNPMLSQAQPPVCELDAFHEAFCEEAQATLQQPLLRLKTLWDYFLDGAIPRRYIARIRKARTLAEYHLATQDVFALL